MDKNQVLMLLAMATLECEVEWNWNDFWEAYEHWLPEGWKPEDFTPEDFAAFLDYTRKAHGIP